MLARHGVTAAEATEAVEDVDALWFDPDPKSTTGKGVRVVGYSHTRQRVLTVLLLHRQDEQEGYWGVNGWPSSPPDRRRYEQGE